MSRRRTAHRPRIATAVTVEVRCGEQTAAEAAADWAFVRSLGRRSAMTSVGSMRQSTESMVLSAFDRLCEIVESQPHVTLIARRDGRRIGFLLLLDELPDEVTALPQGFVAYMAVEPDWRRDGVGSALLLAAEDEARRRGLPYMALMVTEENEAGRRLYAERGYQTERRLLCKPL
jgi:ribosomal protein S18 acetylase RimI-like enzyme